MRDRYLTLNRRVQRAERIACPPRITVPVGRKAFVQPSVLGLGRFGRVWDATA